MKRIFILGAAALALTFFAASGMAAEKTDAKAELQTLVAKVKDKLRAGKNTEADLAEDLKQFDALLAEHQAEKTDDIAQILFMKALLYVEVLDNTEKAATLIKQLKTDFPDTRQGKQADAILASIEKQEAAKKIQRGLAVGSQFPDFDEKDFAGKPLSIGRYKGKIVLVDFWATWCSPCVGEFPNVLKTYEKLHPKGFEIVGISLDEKAEALTEFIKARGVTWQQYFDGKGWGNKLAGKYGINSIPATFLLDGDGKILAKDLRGEALGVAVEKALPKP